MEKLHKVILASTCAVMLFVLGAADFTSAGKKISIRTTPDAFVVPATAAGEQISADLVLFAITPAPWPEEAHLISSAAKRGKIVHVTVVIEGRDESFDVIGVSSTGQMLASIASMSTPDKITKMLKYGISEVKSPDPTPTLFNRERDESDIQTRADR